MTSLPLQSRVIVDDDMDRLFLGNSGLDDVQKPDELLMAMALHALVDNLAIKDIERGEQGSEARTSGPWSVNDEQTESATVGRSHS